jgi:hypothetical protein
MIRVKLFLGTLERRPIQYRVLPVLRSLHYVVCFYFACSILHVNDDPAQATAKQSRPATDEPRLLAIVLCDHMG